MLFSSWSTCTSLTAPLNVAILTKFSKVPALEISILTIASAMDWEKERGRKYRWKENFTSMALKTWFHPICWIHTICSRCWCHSREIFKGEKVKYNTGTHTIGVNQICHHHGEYALNRVPMQSLFAGKVLTFDDGSLGPGKVLSFSSFPKRSWKSTYFLIKGRLMNRCLMWNVL